MRLRWLTPLAFPAGLLLLGLFTLDFYGVTWDEPLHRGWGESIWAYLVTGDEARVADLPGNGLYYGPIFYILNYGLSQLAHEVLGVQFAAANHLLTLLTASLGVLCTFLLAEILGGRRAAVAAATLLFLYPPFIAHAHYNPKDIPLLTLAVATFLFATKAYRFRRFRHVLLSGFFLGLAVAVKPTAVVLLPVVGGAVLTGVGAWWPVPLRQAAKLMAAFGLASLAGLLVGWPTLWGNPSLLWESARYFGNYDFWTGEVLYFGEATLAAQLPWHYAPVMLLMTLPLVILVPVAVGAFWLVRRALAGERAFAAVLLFLWILLPLALFMKPGLPRYDGMRQLFFVIPALAIVGGRGWEAFSRIAVRGPWARRVVAAAAALGVGWLTLENVRVFPFGGSYVSEAVRALHGPHLERSFEVEYWGASYRQGARWLQENAPANSVVCVPVAPQVLEWQEDVRRDDLMYDCARDPQFIMVITRFSQWPDEYRGYASLDPVFAVSRFRSDLLHVHRLP